MFGSGRCRAFVPALVSALVVHAAAADAKPISLTLSVSPKIGTVSDHFVVTVVLELSGVGQLDRFTAPAFGDFHLVDTNTSHSTRVLKTPQGATQLRTVEKRTYVLQPRRAGKLIIGPARVRVNGVDHNTRRVSVSVHPGGAQRARRSADPDPTADGIGAPGFRQPTLTGHPDMFLHAVVDKTDPYVGEQVMVTWLLYTKDEVLRYEPRPPRLDFLWSEKVYEPDRDFEYHDDVVDGNPYKVAVVAKRALFATKSGKVVVQAYRAKIIGLYSANSKRNDVASNTITLHVKELPPGAPPGFDATYVGEFDVEASIDRDDVKAGEPITFTLKVRGIGAIRRTTPPKLKAGGFRFKSPRDFDESIDTSGDLVRGERVYRYLTTPQQGGHQTIPPLKIPYFNPRTGSYQIAASEPIPLLVRGNPRAGTITNVDGTENFIAPDIRLIREGDTISSVTIARAYKSFWFWLIAAIPLFGFVVIFVIGRVQSGMQKDTPRSRLRRARGKARKRFKEADIHLRGNQPSKFFGELARVIYEHIEERVGHPVRSLTRVDLRQVLEEQGFAEETIQMVDDELQNCDFARFTPSASGPTEMKAALQRTQDTIKAIEKTRVTGEEEAAA